MRRTVFNIGNIICVFQKCIENVGNFYERVKTDYFVPVFIALRNKFPFDATNF